MKSIPGHDEVELLEKQLFQSLSRDEPPVKAKHVAAAALGLGSAALTSATAAEGAAVAAVVKASPLLLVKWVGIGTVVGVASIGAIRYSMPRSNAVAPHAVATVAAAPAQARDTIARTGGERAAPETEVNQAPSPEAPSPEVPSRVAPAHEGRVAQDVSPELPAAKPAADVAAHARPSRATPAGLAANDAPAAPIPGALTNAAPSQLDPASPTPAITSSQLAAEVAMLDQARGAVAAKSGERALEVLGRYARQFPAGTLNLEATVLRIEALFLTGATAPAAALAREFLAAHPSSTHASHVRRLLAEHEKP
jgi:hypothetical protein